MAGPRFQFVCSNSGRLNAASTDELACERVAWRLLGGNNRELGRSALWYPDLDACLEAVRALKREIGGVTSAITSAGQSGGAWSWRLAVSGRPVAMAGRPYHRHRECAYNLSHFVAAVPAALVADEPCTVGRR
jgi:hypothetical protein